MRKTLRSSDQRLFLDLMREARKAAGFTQAALAKKLRRPQSFVVKYENGERRLDVIEFLALARALQADPIVLLRKTVEAKGGGTQITSGYSAPRRRGGTKDSDSF